MAKAKYYTCGKCGTRFMAGRKVYQDAQSKRYICPACFREMRTGMRQSYLSMFIKLLLGIGCVGSAMSGEYEGIIVSLIVLAFGLLLLFSSLYPFFTRKRRKKKMIYK